MFNRRDISKLGAAAATSSLAPPTALAQSASSLVEAAKAAGQTRVVIAMGAGTYDVTAPENWSKVAKVDAIWLNENRSALTER
ncbi:hypothetical protein EN751_26135 [Mesorhizobium sp. M4A.F.Ca.ET.029.04.2.1]|nr:hypothetical protein EN751_26135 [Mesorhizobium sp. M4A.F.Ca.ET.029.04.2.1]